MKATWSDDFLSVMLGLFVGLWTYQIRPEWEWYERIGLGVGIITVISIIHTIIIVVENRKNYDL